MPAVLILNPAAGRGRALRTIRKIDALLSAKGLDLEIWETARRGDGVDLASEAVDRGFDPIIACGGDGTISEVAAGLIGSDATLGVLPLGTGNDLARHFGIHHLGVAVECIVSGQPVAIDLGTWQSDTSGGYFLNVAGTGFDALVAERVNLGYRRLRGTTAYLAAVFETLRTFEPTHVRINIDGEELEARAMLCAIANASSYGGGMRIAPNAKTGDGLLDVVLVREVGRGEFLRTLPKVFFGRHLDHPAVTFLQGRQVKIESDQPWPVLCDGEACGGTPIKFGIKKRALRILAP